LQFQAWPGGTGALMERLIRERGAAAFERQPIDIAPWEGPLPASEEDVAYLPAHRLGALLRARHITSVELTGIYLERLKRYDPLLLCVATLLEGRAREEAQQVDAEIRRGEWRGPLHGVPWGVKDLFSARGAPTMWGDADFEQQVIDEDAEVIVRLRAAGAVLLAKLATGQFALGDRWFRGRTNNPWNLELGSSGSSAGPASAAAAGLVGFSIGTETQGSILSPSRRCGISALRPTFGRISRAGGMVLSWSMDKPGPMCRSIEDCALVFHVVHGADPADPATLTTPFRFERRADLAGLRIGYAEGTPESFMEALRALGAELTELPELPRVRTPSIAVESAAAFDFHVGEAARAAEERGEEPPRGRFLSGRGIGALEYVQAQRRRWRAMQEWEARLAGLDAFVGGGGDTNQTGHPAVVVPYAFGPEGDQTHDQPRTVTLFGPVFEDDRLLAIADAYQRTRDWHLRRPELG
ncbi:MAG TPA: amidase, partial [Longimicrobiales bacterium]|nr:amidase [Longimicrobiales bacterium]